MTKIEYIDFIRNSLQMVDKTAKFHREQVSAAINVAVNTVFYDLYMKNPKAFRKSMERYSPSLTGLTITTPLGYTYYTSTITFDVVDLPTKTGGVLEIIPNAAGGDVDVTQTIKYIPLSSIETRQLYGSESTLPGNVIGYTWSRSRSIEYYNMDAATAALGASGRILKQFKSYSSTDNVVLPYGQDAKIIELVRQYLSGIPPKDLINNEADG